MGWRHGAAWEPGHPVVVLLHLVDLRVKIKGGTPNGLISAAVWRKTLAAEHASGCPKRLDSCPDSFMCPMSCILAPVQPKTWLVVIVHSSSFHSVQAVRFQIRPSGVARFKWRRSKGPRSRTHPADGV